MKFNSQICTTEAQSKRLIALGLKKETADMKLIPYSRFAVPVNYYTNIYSDDPDENDFCRAWSLDRLICMINDSIASEEYKMEFYTNLNRYDEAIALIQSLIHIGQFNKNYLDIH